MSSVRDRYAALAHSQKVPRMVPAYTLYVNRRLGRALAAACPNWVTPNGLTLLGSAVSYGALCLLWVIPVGSRTLLSVGILLVLAFALDSADGQLARLRRSWSVFGGWLDHVLDAGRTCLIHISVAAFFVRSDQSFGTLVVSAVFLVSAILPYTGMLIVDAARDKGTMSKPNMRATPVRSWVLLPTDYGILCALFLLTPWPRLFTAGYALLAVGSAIYCVAYMIKKVRELRDPEEGA